MDSDASSRGFAGSWLAAGLQTGMAGAFAMLGWMLLATLWFKGSLWWFPNLMGTAFGGDGALQNTWNKYSAAGLALHLVQYSLVGAVYARVTPPRAHYGRLLLTGFGLSVGYFLLMYKLLWSHLNPLIPLYSPDRLILIAHVAFAVMLARLPVYLRRPQG